MNKYKQYTDEELLKLLRAGDQQVMDYLIEKYKPMVRKKARVLYLVGGDQDDLIQEGMIGLFKAIQDYCEGKEAAFQTFAQLCVDRQLYHAIQSSNRRKHQPLNAYVSMHGEEWEAEEQTIFQQSPETLLIDRENVYQIEMEIRKTLSKMESRVLEMYLKGNNYLEIAEQLNKTPKAIDNAIQRIRKKVKLVLNNVFGTQENK